MRAKTAWCVLLGLLAAAACGGKGKEHEANRDPKAPVGTVAAVTGEVTYTTAAAPAPQPAAVGLAVTREMTFKTGPGASLEVKFENGYTWKLNENRERAIAKLRVVDLPRAEGGVASVLDDDDEDRTAGAGRHAEGSAADTAATTTAVASADDPAPPPARSAPAEPTVDVPVLVEDGDDDAVAAAPPPRRTPTKRPKTPEKPRAPGGGGGSDIDDLLDDAEGGSGTRVKRAAPAPGGPPERTTTSVGTVMNQHRRHVLACFEKFATKGTVKVKFTIQPNGNVTDVSTSGDLAGTPTAGCIASAVGSIRFPPAGGGPITVSYPFVGR